MDTEKTIEAVAAISLLGLPVIIVLVVAGSLLFGFALYSIIAFLNHWMLPLLFVGVGLFGAYFGFKYGAEHDNVKFAGLGILVLIFSLAMLGVYSSGILAGPVNSYTLLGYSITGSSTLITGFDYANVVLQTLFFASGFGLLIVELHRLHSE